MQDVGASKETDSEEDEAQREGADRPDEEGHGDKPESSSASSGSSRTEGSEEPEGVA